MEDFIFKVCIFGDGGVGKTTLIRRYLTGMFDSTLKMTIGVDFHIKKIEIEKKRITLQIWDFAGEERFRILLPSYVRGAKGGIFMFDITRYSSLINLDEWLEVVKSVQRDIPLMMVGGKLDLNEQRSISSEIAKELADANNFYGYGECSSKTGLYVEEIFELLTHGILEKSNFI